MLQCEELLCGTDLQVVVQYGPLLYLQYVLLQSLQCGLYYELHFECLTVSWPEFGGSVVSLVKSILHRSVLPGLDLKMSGDGKDECLRFSWTLRALLAASLQWI